MRSSHHATRVVFAVAALLSVESARAADSYLCYSTRPVKGSSVFSRTSAELADETSTRSLEIVRPRTLCAPVDVGAGIGDAQTMLRGYRARPTRGEAALESDAGIAVANDLGDHWLDTKARPTRVLIPAALGATAPDEHVIDHYRCQKAATSDGSPSIVENAEIAVTGAWAGDKRFRIVRPLELCTPVSAFGTPVADPAASLVCYSARRVRGEARHTKIENLAVADALYSGAMNVVAEVELCLSSRAIARCNGFADLCDRGYGQVSYATTHNSMSNAAEGWLGPNQPFGITTQLDDGIRALMLDTWYFNLQPVLCHGGDVVPCDVAGMKPLADGLAEITDFLDRRPNEVVSIIFESYITEADTAAAFVAADLLRHVHVQPLDDPWPTLRELIETDTRLVVMTDEHGALPWHHYVWDYAWETRFSFQNPSQFSCTRNRGSAANELFILNHFLTNFIGSPAQAEQVNHNPLFIDRAEQCQAESGRLPNFVTVDFYDIGDVFAVVDSLNGVTP